MNAFPQELRSKRIYRIAGGYVVSAWLVLQVASVIAPSLALPAWTLRALLGILLLGFSVALFTGWHLAYAYNLYWVYRDYQRAKVQLAMARRGLPNDVAAILLAAHMDRRQGNWEKAIQDFNEAIVRDPRNPESISELGDTFFFTRQFRAAEEAYDRLIELVPDKPMLKVARAFDIARQSGDAAPVRSALAAVPASMDDDTGVLCWRLRFALYDRD